VAENPDVAELVAVVDTDPSRFANVCQEFGLSVDMCFSSFDALTLSDVQVDACIIGTPAENNTYL
jgi:predicted dehydrogenase